MNRNTNAHFSELPAVEVARSTFDRSHGFKFSGNVGDIIPVFCEEILPGDTVSMDTSKVIRFQTMLSPIMDNLYGDMYYFFVPNRLVWDHWQEFMGENSQSAWLPRTQYSVPQLNVSANPSEPGYAVKGSILDYLGFPVESSFLSGTRKKINALPFRGVAKIFNDWFRDENLTDPVDIYTGDADVDADGSSDYRVSGARGGPCLKAAKFADYFTSCLPDAQKASEPVTLNFATNDIPVYALNKEVDSLSSMYTQTFYTASQDKYFSIANSSGSPAFGTTRDDFAPSSSTGQPTPINLWAVPGESGLSFNVNDLRFAFQLQKLLERDARGGTRYIEILKAHFGVTSPDARLQRSEYLGGNRFPIVVDQVTNNSQSEQEFLGDLGAYSCTADLHSDFTHSFVEHGYLFGLFVVRYDHTYSQGIPNYLLRSDRYSFYWPEFANIGEQPVMEKELFLSNDAADEDVFGFQEAWASYRYAPNRLAGEMRPYLNQNLGIWHLGDRYTAWPALSDSWIREDQNNVDRVLAVTSTVSDQFWADFYFDFKHTRPMPVYSIPGLIDHN